MEWILEIVLGLVSAGALGLCKYFHSKMKKYKALTKEKSQEEIVSLIQEEIKPIIKELHSLQDQVEQISDKECEDVRVIVTSYKFRLIQLCTKYMKQNYVTPGQFEQLSEFYRVYTALGGNGQAKAYYAKVLNLPIREPQDVEGE